MAATWTERRRGDSPHGRRIRALAVAPGLIGLVACAALCCPPIAAASTKYSVVPAKIEAVPYGSSSFQESNIYPSPVSGSPVVVLVHGGGWRKDAWLGVVEPQAKSLQGQGFTVYEINYRHDTTTTTAFPMEPNDVIAATRFAISTASSYGGDPSKVVMVGGSAGAQLSALAAGQIDAETPGAVDGVVTLSTAGANFLTLRPLIEQELMINESFEISVERALGWYLSKGGSFPQAYAERWSPTLHPPAGATCPRFLLFNSEEEFIPLSQAEEMQQSLTSAGCSSSLTVVPGNEHGFMYFHVVKPQVFNFIRAVTGS
jgi:acetyl esterase/lipase